MSKTEVIDLTNVELEVETVRLVIKSPHGVPLGKPGRHRFHELRLDGKDLRQASRIILDISMEKTPTLTIEYIDMNLD